MKWSYIIFNNSMHKFILWVKITTKKQGRSYSHAWGVTWTHKIFNFIYIIIVIINFEPILKIDSTPVLTVNKKKVTK